MFKLTLETYPENKYLSEIYLEEQELVEVIKHLNKSCKTELDLNFKNCLNYYLSLDLVSGETINLNIKSVEPRRNLCLSAFVENGLPLDILFPLEYSFIEEILLKETKNLDCCDNFRVCLKDSEEGLIAYNKAKDSGCCGCFDKEFTINNKVFLIGFNYGH